MKTKKQNQEKRTVEILVNYRVYKGEEMVADEMLKHSVTDEEIKEVAAIMERNGGYPVEMRELEKLSDQILEDIYIDEITRLYPDEEDYDDYYVELNEVMPQNLLMAAQQYIKYKDVDVTFYLDVEGSEVSSSFLLRVTQNAFDKMREVAKSGPHYKSDFDVLKEQAPEAYKEMSDLIFEWAYKLCIRDYGEAKPCVLKEFPYQVYENL